MATRAKIRKKSLKESPPKPMAQFQKKTFTKMFLLWAFNKIAKIVWLPWTKWLPQLKIENPLNNNFFKAKPQTSR